MKTKERIAIDALMYYADGWHYRKTADGDVSLGTGEVALKALHKLGVVCNRPNCKRCLRMKPKRVSTKRSSD